MKAFLSKTCQHFLGHLVSYFQSNNPTATTENRTEMFCVKISFVFFTLTFSFVSVGAASVSECLLSEILKNNELLISRLDHDLGHLTDHQTNKLLDNQIKKLLENSQTF